jgi:hypothetical protein
MTAMGGGASGGPLFGPGNALLAGLGIALVALGLAQRLAFFTWVGLALVLFGFVLLGLALRRGGRPRGREELVYPLLFSALGLTAALAPILPDGVNVPLLVLTGGAVVAFYALGLTPRLRRWRLLGTLTLLLGAGAAVIVQVPYPPHQDVFRLLNYGVDALVRGQNPYGQVMGADGGLFRFTYPPAILVLLAPFRVILGDIRWGYIVAEALAVLLVVSLIRQRSTPRRLAGDPPPVPHARTPRLARWEEALLLTPLALPRAGQAFFVFSNHEWVLLALTAGALSLRASWIFSGVVLGLGIASKQYFLVFPALFLLPAVSYRGLAFGAGVALLVTLPFLVWNPGEFINHVFGNLGSAPDPERLTIWAAAAHLGLNPGRAGAFVLAALGAAGTAALWWVGRRNLSTSLAACGLALAWFSLCATFAAYNYYVYALVFCVWALLIPADWERRRPAARAA